MVEQFKGKRLSECWNYWLLTNELSVATSTELALGACIQGWLRISSKEGRWWGSKVRQFWIRSRTSTNIKMTSEFRYCIFLYNFQYWLITGQLRMSVVIIFHKKWQLWHKQFWKQVTTSTTNITIKANMLHFMAFINIQVMLWAHSKLESCSKFGHLSAVMYKH